MRRALYHALPALALTLMTALAACGRAIPPPREIPAEADTPPAPEPPLAASSENPDEPFRYRPPAPAARPSALAGEPKEIRLANGMRAVLIERHAAPVVVVQIALQWKTPPPTPGLTDVFSRLLSDAEIQPSGALVRDALATSGGLWTQFNEDGATYIRIALIPSELERALPTILDALVRARLPESKLAAARDRAAETHRKEPLRDRLHLAIAERLLLPKNDPWRAPTEIAKESASKLTLQAITRYRDAELRPEIISVFVAGDTTPGALTSILEQSAGAWKPGPIAASPRAQEKLPSGAFLVEEREATSMDLALISPTAADPDADITAASDAAAEIFRRRFFAELQSKLQQKWRNGDAKIDHRIGRSFFAVKVELAPSEAAKAATIAFDIMEAIGKGGVSDEELADVRVSFLDWLEGAYDDNLAAVKTLNLLSDYGWTIDRIGRLMQAWRSLSKDRVAKFARDSMKKDQIRLVGRGSVAEAKAPIAALGLGPMSFTGAPPAAPSGGKKK